MDDETIKTLRQALLRAEIKRYGLHAVAKRANKPDRQINDMAAGRKSFGDKVAREIGPLIRPDLPVDWLLTPSSGAAPENTAGFVVQESDSSRYDVFSPAIAEVIQIMEPLTNSEQREIVGAIKLLVGSTRGTHRHSNRRTGQ